MPVASDGNGQCDSLRPPIDAWGGWDPLALGCGASLERGDALVQGAKLRSLRMSRHILSDPSKLADDERHLVAELATELLELRPCDAAPDGFEHDLPLGEGAFVEDHGVVLAVADGGRGSLLARHPRSAARVHEVTASNARAAVQGTTARAAQESLGKGLVRMGIGSARTVPGAESRNPLDFSLCSPVQGRFEGGAGQVGSSPIPSRRSTKPCGAVVEARGHHRSK
jgi:hypothetical protein